jgi:hypothetical protein
LSRGCRFRRAPSRSSRNGQPSERKRHRAHERYAKPSKRATQTALRTVRAPAPDESRRLHTDARPSRRASWQPRSVGLERSTPRHPPEAGLSARAPGGRSNLSRLRLSWMTSRLVTMPDAIASASSATPSNLVGHEAALQRCLHFVEPVLGPWSTATHFRGRLAE